MTVPTPTELALLRARPHRTRLGLSLYVPRVVFAAQVNNPDIALGEQSIAYKNVTTGVYTDVKAGQTLWVGSTAGGRDLGRVRVKAASATALSIAESWDLDWVDELYLTVVAFFEPWPVYPRIVLDAANQPTFYKDYDVAYTDQNAVLDPVPLMGPHRAGQLVAGSKQFYWSAAESYDANGGTITAYAWVFEGGSPASSSVAVPGLVTWTQPGHYTVSLTLTNSAGKSFTAYRHVSVYSAPGGAAPPPLAWGLSALNGDYGSGGGGGQFWVRQAAGYPEVTDGALVVVYAVGDWYGSTAQSIGGNVPGAEDIVFVGYVRQGSVEIDPETSVASFAVTNLAGRMAALEAFSVSLISKSSPTVWYEMEDMTVPRAVYHYLRWHTTLYSLADVHPNASVLPVQYADFAREPMQSAVNQFLWSTLLARLQIDRQGALWMEEKIDIVPVGARTAETALALTRADWRDALQIPQRREPPMSFLEIGGIAYDGPATDNTRAVLSVAPGNAPRAHGRAAALSGLVLLDQETTDQLAGNLLADANKEFPEMRVPLSGNYRIFDLAPQERVAVTLTPAENRLGLSWSGKFFIPRGYTLNYSAEEQTLLVDLVLEEESDGPPGIPGQYPVEQPDSPDTNPLPGGAGDPIPSPRAGGAEALVALQVDFRRAKNFTATAPNWQAMSGRLIGTIRDFRRDPYNARRALLAADNGIWRTASLHLTPPIWTRVIAPSQFLAATGKVLRSVRNVRYTPARARCIYAQAETTDDWIYALRSLDDGQSWVVTAIAPEGARVGEMGLGFAVSTHSADVLWSAGGNGELWKCVNGLTTFSWSLVYTLSGAGAAIGNIEVPHDSNVSNNIVYISGSLGLLSDWEVSYS